MATRDRGRRPPDLVAVFGAPDGESFAAATLRAFDEAEFGAILAKLS